MSSTICPAPQALDDFACGRMLDSARPAIEAHLDTCPACSTVVAELAHMASSTALAPGELPTVPGDGVRTHPGASAGSLGSPVPRLGPGTTLGRYRIDEVVGAGAMGVVYAATDPDLNRRVALKLMHGFSTADDDARRMRLLREAQAMAQLSHPNVVTVHDVGSVGDVVFVAMELVAGGTLGQWMQRRHRWPEVVDVFVAAARGLSAAHAAGIVHRDFKPDNVLVGSDHRVRVTDFGLARHLALAPTEPEGSEQIRPAELELTRVGSVIGTPAYMSPEQLAGRPADARSDQFSLCVALWEALFGARPFSGRTLAQIATSIEDGPPTAPGGRVPARVVRAVRRGLLRHPSERFETIDGLVAELEGARRRRRGTWIAIGAGAVVLVAGSVAGTLAVASSRHTADADAGTTHVADEAPLVDVCAASESALGDAWDDAARDELRAAFARAAPDDTKTAAATLAAIDEWAAEWTATHRRACELTHVTRDRSPEILDKETRCLTEVRGELTALREVLATSDRAGLARAGASLDDLNRPSRCIDPAFLERWVLPPQDPAVAAEVERIHAELLRARAMIEAGHYDDAHAVVTTALADARKTEHQPIMAEAWYRLGAVLAPLGRYEEARDAYSEAVWAARAGGHASVELWAAAALVSVVGHDLGQPEEAERWARHAMAQSERLGDEGRDALAEVHSSLGALAFTRGDFAVSRDHHREALALREWVHGKGSYDTATSLHNLAGALLELGDLEQPLQLRRRAVAAAEAALGPNHPRLASFIKGLGNVYVKRGEYALALPLFERALQIRTDALGPNHPEVGAARTDLAIVRASSGDRLGALAEHEAALAIRKAALGDEHVDVARSLATMASLYQDLGRYDEARVAGERALAIRRKVLGDDHPDVGDSLGRLGSIAQAQGRDEDAIAYHRRALELAERRLGPDHPDVLVALSNLSTAERVHGDFDAALAHLERARGLAEALYGSHSERLATVLENLGIVHELQGRSEDALAMHEAALQMRREVLGERHHDVARSFRYLGIVHAHRGETTEAIAQFELGLEILEAAGADALPVLVADTRWLLAQSLRASDPDRARRLAETARAEFEAFPDGPDTAMIADIDAWLAKG